VRQIGLFVGLSLACAPSPAGRPKQDATLPDSATRDAAVDRVVTPTPDVPVDPPSVPPDASPDMQLPGDPRPADTTAPDMAAPDAPPDLPPDMPPKQALFVVGDPTLAPTDMLIQTRLRAKGLVVMVADDDVATTANAVGNALVFISSSINSTVVQGKFADVAVPVVIEQAGSYDDMQMTGPVAGTDLGTMMHTQIVIADPAHPLAAGFAAGALTVYNATHIVPWGAPPPSAAAIRVATVVGNPTRAAIFAYPSGAMMVGKVAPAKRVGFFFARHLTMTILNADGVKLLDAAIDWALAP